MPSRAARAIIGAPMSTSCAACGASVPDGAASCPRCGTAQGMTRCPVCGNVGAVVADAELRYACGLCGAPRFKGAVPEGSRAVPLLRKADEARKGRARGRAVAGFGGVATAATGAFTLLLLMLVGLKLWVVLGAALFVGPSVLALLWGLQQAGARGKEIGPAVDAAYLAAAGELVKRGGQATPDDLRAALGLDAEHADQLSAMLEAEAGLGGVRIASPGAGAQPGASGSAKTLEAELAELEAAAEAEANREAAAKRP